MQVVCALVFGKDEDAGGFEFSQELVDEAVAGHFRELLAGNMVQFTPTIAAHFLRPLVHLCISGAPATFCESLFAADRGVAGW